MQAIILAGGFGTRLQSVVKDVPKPMAPINCLPFLAYIFTYLKKYNATDVILSVGYLNEKIVEYFGDSYLGISIKYAFETEPLGTGGAILNSLKLVDSKKPLIVLNGDTFLEIDYKKLLDFHNSSKSKLTMVLRSLEDCSRYGSVIINEDSVVTDFVEKSVLSSSGFINGGIYVLSPEIFSQYNLPKKFSFEQDFLCKYISKISPFGFISNDYFIDIGIPEDYRKAIIDLPKIIKNKALFLDRDGVINIDYGHVHKIADFHFIEGIFELCIRAQEKCYLIIIVTNQAGIAKGYYSEEQFLDLTEWMEKEFRERGITIAKTYYCPYHVESVTEKYRKDSFDRKPNPGMLMKAIDDFNLDSNESILIGDKESDIEAAKSAKIGNSVIFDHKDSFLLSLSYLFKGF